MTTLTKGDQARPFTLTDLNNKTWSMGQTGSRRPLILVFFKTSCPTCQFAFPFLERIYQSRIRDEIDFLGISQDDAIITREFAAEYGISFPILIDTTDYLASILYGLTNVPTVFLIDEEQTIASAHTGFDRAALLDLASRMAPYSNGTSVVVFRPGEIIPDYKPG